MAGSAGEGTVLQKEAEVLFPAFEAVCFSYYKVAIRIFHQGCRDAWAITGLAQQAKDTAHMLLLAADSRCLASACQNFSLSSR